MDSCILFKLYFALNWNWNGLTIWPKIFCEHIAHIYIILLFLHEAAAAAATWERKKNESFYFEQNNK